MSNDQPLVLAIDFVPMEHLPSAHEVDRCPFYTNTCHSATPQGKPAKRRKVDPESKSCDSMAKTVASFAILEINVDGELSKVKEAV